MSAATMSEVEMQARLDQVRHASMRQFQSMRDVHGRDLERVRRELEARHRAAIETKDRELVEYKKFYENKVRSVRPLAAWLRACAWAALLTPRRLPHACV